jgi:hypothetical protein
LTITLLTSRYVLGDKGALGTIAAKAVTVLES